MLIVFFCLVFPDPGVVAAFLLPSPPLRNGEREGRHDVDGVVERSRLALFPSVFPMPYKGRFCEGPIERPRELSPSVEADTCGVAIRSAPMEFECWASLAVLWMLSPSFVGAVGREVRSLSFEMDGEGGMVIRRSSNRRRASLLDPTFPSTS